MSYFFLRLLLIASPLITWQCVELFVLPTNFFTFRPWEAIRVKHHGLFPGPFYPHQDISMWSAGDLNPRGPRLKRVRFRTDDKGFRNLHGYAANTRYDFLIVGDSHCVGANMDDSDTLAAVLERDHGKTAYNYASGHPFSKAFLNDKRIAANLPRFVVLEFRPEDVVFGRYSTWPTCSPVNDSLNAKLCEPTSTWERLLFAYASDAVRTTYDRASKQLGYNFLRARLMLATKTEEKSLTIKEAEANFSAVITALGDLRRRLRDQGSELIVLLMPVVYPIGVGDLFVTHLDGRVPLVHWQSGSLQVHDADFFQTWYDANDSHWRESSVVLAARRIVAVSEGQ